jgi:nuclear cap-binding protein subunit 2
MAHLYDESTIKSNSVYYDFKVKGNVQKDVLQSSLESSTTLYVGNLPNTVKEEQLHELFSIVGPIERIVLGIDRDTREPCGFCFVEYVTRKDAEDCLKYINGTQMMEHLKPIYLDWDVGYTEGRELKITKRGREYNRSGRRDEPQYNYSFEFDDKKKQLKIKFRESQKEFQSGSKGRQYNNDRYHNDSPQQYYRGVGGHGRGAYNYGSSRGGGNLGKRRRSGSYDDDERSRSRSPLDENARKRVRTDNPSDRR